MKRKRRTEILIKGNRNLAAGFSREITEKYSVKTIQEPDNGLVMVKMRETSQRSLFYLGEVLVSECKVSVDGSLGIGIVSGNDFKLAYDLSVIDAAYNAELDETKNWDNILVAEEGEINRRKAEFQQNVLKTRVNFETMDV